MEDYHFEKNLLLRTPAFSYAGDGLALGSPFFRAALLLANPVFYGLLKKKAFDFARLSSKEQTTVLSYANRMRFRPTPFGAFAAFSVTGWGQGGIRLPAAEQARLHLFPGLEMSLKLGDINESDPRLTVNAAAYRLKGDYRFLKTSGTGQLNFSLAAIPADRLLTTILSAARPGIRITELVEIVKNAGVAAVEAFDYVRFLVEEQILVPSVQPNLTGADYLSWRLATGSAAKNWYDRLVSVLRLEETVITALTAAAGELTDLPARLFYAGLEKSAGCGGLDPCWQEPLKRALAAARALTPLPSAGPLAAFITEFSRRYDRQKIPLLQALDPAAGITYAGLEKQPASPLLDEIPFRRAAGEKDMTWSAGHRLLLEKWNSREIVLGPEDIAVPAAGSLQNVLPVVFRSVAGERLLLEAAGGPAGAALIGRFAPWSAEVAGAAAKLAELEEQVNPRVVFAELLQRSDDHVDNINRRGQFYNYEIPINTPSLLPAGRQLPLQDLLISVRDGRLILESASLKKVVVPRLSSAFNYRRTDLPVFRLLCDLQYQDLAPVTVPDLEQFFPGLAYYPRLRYEQVIFSPAKWYLDEKQLASLTTEAGLTALKVKLGWPDWVAVTRHDQQLVFDLRQTADCRLLLAIANGANRLAVQEFFLPADTVSTTDSEPLVNQFIGFLSHTNEIYTGRPVEQLQKKGKRFFPPGSDWLYLKLYVNPAVADELLVTRLAPILARLGLPFFFVRYQEDGYHIRLRLQVEDQKAALVLIQVNRALAGDINLQLIRDFQAATYEPEWERYGRHRLAAVESYFCASSELVLAYLVRARKELPCSFYSLGLVSVSELVALFIPADVAQLVFLEQMTAAFYAEFAADKELSVALTKKYRLLKNELRDLLTDTGYYTDLKLSAAHINFIAAAKQLARGGDALLADLIHMHLNRLFAQRQRKHELVIYYCLWQQRRSRLARAKPRGGSSLPAGSSF